MKVVIVVYPGMTALDAIGPYEVFNSLREFEIQFAWKETGPIVTDSKALILHATHAFADIKACDIVLVPGSSTDTATMMMDEAVTDWLRVIDQTTQFTTSVCTGSLILGAAGLLNEKRATTHWAAMPALTAVGAMPEPNQRVVREGKLITAAGVSAGIDLALQLVADLLSEEKAKASQLMIEYDPQPPFDSGHISKVDDDLEATARSYFAKALAMKEDDSTHSAS
ncbi:MAG: DJ-1/PfpI family protein [Chloroflexota bacterium]